MALLRASRQDRLAPFKGDNHDQDAGIKIVLRAVEQPLREIVSNAGLDEAQRRDQQGAVYTARATTGYM